MPAADALVNRAFYAETRCVIAAAVQGLESERERRA